MFNCCGCPSKKGNRTSSEDEDEEKEKEAEAAAQEPTKIKIEREVVPEEIPLKVQEPEKEEEKVVDQPSDTVLDTVPEIIVDTGRKTSLKKPKPRLSISTEVKIIPSNFDTEEETVVDSPVFFCDVDLPPNKPEGYESPLSDEVFAGVGTAPPRPNLGVGPSTLDRPGEVEFPRSPQPADRALALDVPVSSPRGKVSTPHPVKRGSMPAVLPRWVSEDDDEGGGTHEPPVTPVAKDELALRRHRFFADLLTAAQAAAEHRVRFDPLGPEIARDSDSIQQAKELEALLERLENITARLEKTVPILEEKLEPLTKGIVVTKSLEDLLDEHLTPTEKKKINSLVSDKIIISPDSSADVEDLSERVNDFILTADKLDNEEIEISPEELLKDDDDLPTPPDNIAFEQFLEEEEEEYQEIDKATDEAVKEEIEDLIKELPEDIVEESKRTELEDIEEPESEFITEPVSFTKELDADNGDFSDRGERSSESPDTVVCDIPVPNGDVPPLPEENKDLTMTNSPNIIVSIIKKIRVRAEDLKESESSTRSASSQSTLNMSVQGFLTIVQGPLATYLRYSNQIGGVVAEHAKLVEQAFQTQLDYLSTAAQSRKPNSTDEQNLLLPTSRCIQAIQEFREKHRASPLFNHLSAISESIPALGWVTVSPTPSPFVKEMNDAGQFYTNRVLKDWKEKDKNHVEWSKAWVQTLTELQGFVKQYHTTGLVWSGTGSVPTRVGPPPPPSGPMPPPPPPLDLNLGELDLGSNERSALFAEINRGTDITKGLKKVTNDMQTHKNPALRSGPAPFKVAPIQGPRSVAVSQPVDKPPVFTRDGKKWLVEYQKGNRDIVIEGAEMNNVVYVFRCQDSTITIKGKINSIFLDSCKKTAVVFDNVVSSIEFVNCQSVQMQVFGAVPTISIDKTDGCQMYLSDKSLDVEIFSSKSSEMNVLVPKANGDFTEFPVPEQFKTKVGKIGLTTVAVESTG